MKRLDNDRLDTIALKWAYGNKKLNEKNVDCFKAGFKRAETIRLSEPIKDTLNDISLEMSRYINDKGMFFAYAQGCTLNYNDYNKVTEAKKHIIEAIKLLEDMIEDELTLDGSITKK